MNIVIKEAIVDQLTFLVNGGVPTPPHAGICWLIQRVVSSHAPDGVYVGEYQEWKDIFHAVCVEWPKWTNSVIYPVPMSAERYSVESAALAFDMTDNKWDRTTEYGANRLELAQLLLDAVIDCPTTNDNIHRHPCNIGKLL